MENEVVVKFTDRELDCLYGCAKLRGLKISEVVEEAVLEKLKEDGFIDDEGDRGKHLKTLKKIYEGLSIDDLFAGYSIAYKQEEIDWGDPVGEEVW